MATAREALRWMKEQAKDRGERVLFRGQTHVWPTIRPSIAREEDRKTREDMWAICRGLTASALAVTGYAIQGDHDRLGVLQHYILRSPVIDLTGTPEVALYFALLGAEVGQECVVYAVDRCAAGGPTVAFSNPSFSVLPPHDGGVRHRWSRQDGYAVGPADWRDAEAVEDFDLLTVDGVHRKCFRKGSHDDGLVSGLGDLQSLDDDPLASRVRGVVARIAASLDVFPPGIQGILAASNTRDPDAELAAEIEHSIALAAALAEEVNAPRELIQQLAEMRRTLERGQWDAGWAVGLSAARQRLSDLKPSNHGQC